MSTPFLSEIRIMSFNYAPKGWAMCNGQTLPIAQNQPLFALLGTTYGGNGQTVFGLPNLQGRAPIHVGNGFNLGQTGGEMSHTLSVSEMPAHTHQAFGSSQSANSTSASNAVLGSVQNLYGGLSNATTLDPSTIANAGGSQPHPNMQPYLTLNFSIALQGIFPSRS